ncbi:MAG: hypothetical protein RL329_1578 [Bacteroidota bacterium]|jgi:hypothetical protein
MQLRNEKINLKGGLSGFIGLSGLYSNPDNPINSDDPPLKILLLNVL